jgi:hypothetical protein
MVVKSHHLVSDQGQVPRRVAKPHHLAFDQGQMPRIALINESTEDLGVGWQELVDVLQKYVTAYLVPHWLQPAILEPLTGSVIPPGHWGLVFSDTTTDAEANGFHDLTPDGYPLGHVFVKSTKDDGSLVSVTASHELAEMLVDPAAADGTYHLEKKILFAREICDPVGASKIEIDGIHVCSFVFPSWFEPFRKPGSVRFDYLGECSRPFHILKGGYIPILEHGQWSYRFGSKRAAQAFNPQAHPRIKWRRRWRGRKSKPVAPGPES